MDEILDEIARAARRCESASQFFTSEPLSETLKRLYAASHDVGEAWSGSCIGYHSTVYIQGLRPRNPGEHFDSEWGGLSAFSNRTSGEWAEYSYQAVEAEILERARVEDVTSVDEAAEICMKVFTEVKAELVPIYDVLLSDNDDSVLKDL